MFLLPKFLLLAKQGSPAFNPLTSSLSGLIESLTKMKADSFVQQELDKIAFSDAFRYSRAIQYLVDEKTALCYTHFDLTKFDAKLENSNQLDTSDTYILRYTSKTFRIKASLYCIAPRTRSHHIGFIQHCHGKEDTAYYDDGSFNSRVPSVSFPIGDSAGAEHAPFYYRPTANNNAPAYGNKTVHPPHMDIAGKSGWQNLEMNDYFNRNSIPRHPKFKNGSTTAYTFDKSSNQFREKPELRLLVGTNRPHQ